MDQVTLAGLACAAMVVVAGVIALAISTSAALDADEEGES